MIEEREVSLIATAKLLPFSSNVPLATRESDEESLKEKKIRNRKRETVKTSINSKRKSTQFTQKREREREE